MLTVPCHLQSEQNRRMHNSRVICQVPIDFLNHLGGVYIILHGPGDEISHCHAHRLLAASGKASRFLANFRENRRNNMGNHGKILYERKFIAGQIIYR